MLLSAAPTPYDWRFTLLGVPVRVHPAFWIVALLLGGSNDLAGALTWVAAVFVSILVHEFGHALVQRAFGGRPEVTLYAMGGLAGADGVVRSPFRNVLISLAGPFAGFALAAATYGIDTLGFIGATPQARWFVQAMFWINLVWSAINLAPVWPLDGGQVARELLTSWLRPALGIRVSLVVSMLCAAAMAAWLYAVTRSLWNAALFGFLAYESYQTLQRYQASRGGY